MVRQSKQTTDEKKDTHKKKTQQQDKPSSPKKPSDSTVWPCKINGCNKQFAREADLKRHQRTTKLHSVPGFACPQCDARFTRTDALRRHQKSRHNGLVIEPTDQVVRRTSMCSEDHPSSGSRSKSRSRTPSSKGNPTSPNSVPPGAYYRQHTFAGVIVPPPGMVGDGHYSQAAGLPTSATRLHQASWQPAPPWAGDGSQPPPHVIGYAHPYYNAPPQYYRPTTIMQSPDVLANEQVQSATSSSSNGESSPSRKSSPVVAVDPSLDNGGMDDPQIGDTDTTVIDPSLVSPSGSSIDNEDYSVDDQVSRVRVSSKHISSSGAGRPLNDGSSDGEITIVQHLLSPSDDDPFPSHHTTHLEHSLDLEQILTEDGEPMLNPAELLTQVSASNAGSPVLDLMLQFLTQESLASPPPS